MLAWYWYHDIICDMFCDPNQFVAIARKHAVLCIQQWVLWLNKCWSEWAIKLVLIHAEYLVETNESKKHSNCSWCSTRAKRFSLAVSSSVSVQSPWVAPLCTRSPPSTPKWPEAAWWPGFPKHSADTSLQIDCIVHYASSLDFYCKVWGIIVSSKSFSKLENLQNCQWQIIFKLATFLPNNCLHCSAAIALSLASLSSSYLAFLKLLYRDIFQKFGPE